MENSSSWNLNKEMDAPISSFKDRNQQLFKLAASSLTQFYSNSNNAYDEGYAQGRQEAFEEVFKWFTYQNDSSLRHVSVVSFFSYINEKLIGCNSKLAQGKYL